MATSATNPIALVCLDIDGTVTRGIGGAVIAGAPEALVRLRRRRPIRFVTNATSQPRRAIAAALGEAGLLAAAEELVTPADTARRVLLARGQARGILLVEPAAAEDYAWFDQRPEAEAGTLAVLLATEAHGLTIAALQPAFRALLAGAALYSAQTNRYFRRGDELVTDLGPVASFLAYASGRSIENLGKPSPLLFDAIAAEHGIARGSIVMAGDDAEFDASGAVAIGMAGILVQTGKYRPGDETRVEPRPTAVIASVAELPEWIAARG